ncbi:MAG: acetoacetate--CoA ligase [Chloroflexota bacterium]
MPQDYSQGSLLWQPTAEIINNSNLTHFRLWLNDTLSLSLDDYDALWQWSVDNIASFWEQWAQYAKVIFHTQPTTILADSTMPNAQWFTDATLNYAENIFSRYTDERPMMVYKAEDQDAVTLRWADIYAQVNQLATRLRQLGVEKGDRVVNFMPNRPESIVALLAVTSIGAVWSSCSPDFGARSVLDRFIQIEPKVLFAVDGYRYGGKDYNRRDVVAELQANLPTLQQTILVPHIDANTNGLSNTVLWDDALTIKDVPEKIAFEPVPFDHPLWVLYSSGTTGLPKPIVHGHGGVVLEHMKMAILHADLKPDDNFFWYTSTGWMMWNYLVGALLSGATILVYDGSPAYPDMSALFAFSEDTDMTYFGTSAAFISACMNAENDPSAGYDLSKIRAVGSTGSPLTSNGFQWIYEHINTDLALESVSGGTDLCTAFLGGVRTKPIYAGEIQGACLGVDVHAYNEDGEPVLNEVGELVITQPMPSMPIYFWNDLNKARYKSAYFEMYDGIWRHGDWIEFNERGGAVIYGRSDSTINRQGIRMGTSEIYQAVEALPQIIDSLIIDLELLGRDSYMPLFVVLREGDRLDEDLRDAIKKTLRENVSPRHVPNEIFSIDAVPYTLSGKKMEVPIRKILLGRDASKAINKGAMRNPESIDYFMAFAERLNTSER